MNTSPEKIVRVPTVPNTTRDTDNSVFNSVGYYQGLQETLENQRDLLIQVLNRNHRGAAEQN